MRYLKLTRDFYNIWRDLIVHDRRGVLTFELALVVSALGLLGIGVIDLSLAFSRKAEMTNVVRAGTQFALVRKPSLGPSATEQEELMSLAEIRDAVIQSASFLHTDPGSPELDVTVFCECPDTTPVTCAADPGVPLPCQDRITLLNITLNNTYTPILPYPGLPDSYGLEAAGTIRLN
jgi:hypothetical protein